MPFLHEPMAAGDIIVAKLAIFILFFIPGFLLSLAIFPKAIFPKRRYLSMAARTVLSFILCFTPTFLIYFGDRIFNMAINTITVATVWILVCVIAGAVWFLRTKRGI